MSVVRVRPGVECVVYVEKLGTMIALTPDKPFESSDPVVKQCPWAFAEPGEETARTRRVSSKIGHVEQATAAPGEVRGK